MSRKVKCGWCKGHGMKVWLNNTLEDCTECDNGFYEVEDGIERAVERLKDGENIRNDKTRRSSKKSDRTRS